MLRNQYIGKLEIVRGNSTQMPSFLMGVTFKRPPINGFKINGELRVINSYKYSRGQLCRNKALLRDYVRDDGG